MEIIDSFSGFDHGQELISKINILRQHLSGLVCFCSQMTHKIIMKDPYFCLCDLFDSLTGSVKCVLCNLVGTI